MNATQPTTHTTPANTPSAIDWTGYDPSTYGALIPCVNCGMLTPEDDTVCWTCQASPTRHADDDTCSRCEICGDEGTLYETWPVPVCDECYGSARHVAMARGEWLSSVGA